MATFLESLPYCFQSFAPKQRCFNLESMENLSGTGTHGADATKGTQGCWGDTHWHCGVGADVSSPYPTAPQTLLSLLGTWGGTSAQQERESNHLLWFAAKERGLERQSAEGGTGSQIQCKPQPVESWAELWNAGKRLQTVLKNYFTSLFPHLCSALGDHMRDWANGEAETVSFKDVLCELIIIIFINYYNLHSLVDFSAFEFYEDCGFSLFYILTQCSAETFPCAPSCSKISAESAFNRFGEKFPQYFLFLRKNIFTKINVSLIYARVCIYNANFPPGFLTDV